MKRWVCKLLGHRWHRRRRSVPVETAVGYDSVLTAVCERCGKTAEASRWAFCLQAGALTHIEGGYVENEHDHA